MGWRILLLCLCLVPLCGGIIMRGSGSDVGLVEIQDTFSSNCINWNLARADGSTLICGTSPPRIYNAQSASWQQALAEYTGDTQGATNLVIDTCFKIRLGTETVGMSNARHRVFAGQINDSTNGYLSCGQDGTNTGDDLACQTSYWDGNSIQNPANSEYCAVPGSGNTPIGEDDWMVVCFQGDPSSPSGDILFWDKGTTDPCPTAGTCATTDMGPPTWTLDLSTDCNGDGIGGVNTGTDIGAYLTANNATRDPGIEINYAMWKCAAAGVCGDL